MVIKRYSYGTNNSRQTFPPRIMQHTDKRSRASKGRWLEATISVVSSRVALLLGYTGATERFSNIIIFPTSESEWEENFCRFRKRLIESAVYPTRPNLASTRLFPHSHKYHAFPTIQPSSCFGSPFLPAPLLQNLSHPIPITYATYAEHPPTQQFSGMDKLQNVVCAGAC